jgi:hypothetical protein
MTEARCENWRYADVIRQSLEVDVPMWRQLDVHDVRQVPVPCLVGVHIDVAKLIKLLGPKALKSKGKKATMLYGAIVIAAKERTGEHQPAPARQDGGK